jgi:hypothetical protein
LALSLNGEKVPAALRIDDFRRMADRVGADPDRTATVVGETVGRLRDAWDKESKAETAAQFEALSTHFEQRLATLPISATG